MKFILSAFLLAASIVVGADDQAGWSSAVNGLRARLVVLSPASASTPFCRVMIEMQNMSDVAGQVKIPFTPDRLDLHITDESGKELALANDPYDGITPDWEPILLPMEGTIKFRISFGGLGYRSGTDKVIVDIGPSKVWVVPQNKKSYWLSGKFTVKGKEGDHPLMDWSGTIDLPKTKIPKAYTGLTPLSESDAKARAIRDIIEPGEVQTRTTDLIVVSDWSEPISLRNENLHDQAIRGRLLIVEGMEPAYGGPPTTNRAMTFVELQNVSGGYDDKGIDICFDVMKLKCELTDATGKLLPKPNPGPWGGPGPFAPSWVRLPYNSTIRLFVNNGMREPLAIYSNGEPWCHWDIAASDTNAYFLSGSLSLSTHTNRTFSELDPRKHGTASLIFPKTRLPTAGPLLSQEAQAILDGLNLKAADPAWRSEFDRIERPETRPPNQVNSGEATAFLSDSKRRLKNWGVRVAWNATSKRYEVVAEAKVRSY